MRTQNVNGMLVVLTDSGKVYKILDEDGQEVNYKEKKLTTVTHQEGGAYVNSTYFPSDDKYKNWRDM